MTKKKLKEDIEEKNEIDKYEESLDEPLIMSDYEHKMELTKTRVKKEIEDINDMIIKDLQLSIIDSELAYIYSVKISCAEEWLSMGFAKLAKRRFANVLIRLNLRKSIDGTESILQRTVPSVTADLNQNIAHASERMEEIAEGEGGDSISALRKWMRKKKGG